MDARRNSQNNISLRHTSCQQQQNHSPLSPKRHSASRLGHGITPCRAESQLVSAARSVVSPQEAEAGVELIAEYRAQESISAANDIESRQKELTRIHGIPAELLKRDIAKCDHLKFIEAQEKLTALRKEALALVSPIFKRLVKSLDDQLNETAVGAEQRLSVAGLPVRNGDSWLLHD